VYSCLSGVGDYEFACLGDADAALATFDSGLGDETDSGDRLQLLGGVFLIRAIRGEDVSAILREMEGLAATVSDPRFGGSPEQALLALLDGRYGAARDGWRAAVQTLETAVENPAWAARAALWAGDGVEAGADLAGIVATGLHAPVIDLHRRVVEAGIAALDGRTDDALSLYQDALRGWGDLGITWEEAMTGLDMAMLLDPGSPRVRPPVDRARSRGCAHGVTCQPVLADERVVADRTCSPPRVLTRTRHAQAEPARLAAARGAVRRHRRASPPQTAHCQAVSYTDPQVPDRPPTNRPRWVHRVGLVCPVTSGAEHRRP
jgi:hypothetical protein